MLVKRALDQESLEHKHISDILITTLGLDKCACEQERERERERERENMEDRR